MNKINNTSPTLKAPADKSITSKEIAEKLSKQASPELIFNRRPKGPIVRNKIKPKEDTPATVFDAALLNLQSLLELLGPQFFPPKFYDWLKRYKKPKDPKNPQHKPAKPPKEVTDLDIEAIQVQVIVKNGGVVVHPKNDNNGSIKKSGKTRKVRLALKIGNIIIIIRNGKNEGKGITYPPQKSGDPIVIILDHLDVPDELSMKIVLFHELVHAKQILDPNGIFHRLRDSKKIVGEKAKEKSHKELIQAIKDLFKDNAEAEGHAASLLICALEIQRHAELKKFIEKGIHNTASDLFDTHAPKAKHKVKLLNAILLVIGRLLPDITTENKKLMSDLNGLKALKKILEKAVKDYQKTFPKGSTKILKPLNDALKKLTSDTAIAEAATVDFETCKQLLIKKAKAVQQKSTALQKELNKLDIAQEKLAKKQQEKELERIKRLNAPTKKTRDDAKVNEGALQKEINKINAEIEDLKKAINPLLKAAKEENKEKVEVKKGKKTLQALLTDTIKKAKTAREKLKEAQANSASTLGIITNDDLGLLIGKLIGTLQKPSTTLDKLRLKLELLKKLEKLVEKTIGKMK